VRGLRYIEPIPPRKATGLVNEVYKDVRREFALFRDPRTGRSPYLAHSPAAELLAGVWSVQYESMLVGRVPRADKEAIGAAISALNECPFCCDAHAVLSEAAGGERLRFPPHQTELQQIADPRRRALIEWAAATRSPTSKVLANPPFDEAAAPEIIGTAVAFHYINRVVLVFLGDESVLPTGGGPRRLTERLLALYALRAIRRRHEPGRSLRLLAEADLPADLAWAKPVPHVAGAWARMAAAVEAAAEGVLPASVRALVKGAIDEWDGADPGLSRVWIDDRVAGLDDRSRAVAQLGLLVALAPYQLHDADVASFRAIRRSDRDLVVAVAWSAFATARRISRWLTGRAPGADIDAPTPAQLGALRLPARR
jgi:AhpD family alkylhydroperoxidase